MKIHKIRNVKIYLTIKYLVEEKKYPINMLCNIAKISRSAYYKWINRDKPTHDIKNEKVLNIIKNFYEESNHILSYRQMTIKITRECDLKVNHKRIYRLMKVEGLKSVCRRKRHSYTNSTPEITAQNVLNRKFKDKQSNEKWLTDVTEIKYTGSHKAYLSAILDLGNRSIVAYKLRKFNNNAIVFEIFDEALALNPNAHPIFHSDRGFQYTSKIFKSKLGKSHMIQSVSRVGRCIDNGPMEGLWAILKTEMYNLYKFNDYKSLQSAVDNYINYYNSKRYQKRLNCMTPLEYRDYLSQNSV